MNFGFSSIRSFFQNSNGKITQSASVSGDNNVVNQITNNIVISSRREETGLEAIALAQSTSSTADFRIFDSQNAVGDDREEIKRIVEYRQLANDGDNSAALVLLNKLTDNGSYVSGYFAFRLHFNIGAILQKIGELEQASVALRTAHDHCPENYKAQSGLAFAELLEDKYELALDRSLPLVEIVGDHQGLAASVALHAAKSLGREIDTIRIREIERSFPDVFLAHLEYLRVLNPSEYIKALNNHFKTEPDNDVVAAMWALSILDDMKRNQSFLLGQKMSDGFEENVSKCAKILQDAFEKSFSERPPNKLLLPSESNNAAVALRLSGRIAEAAQLVDKTLQKFPELKVGLAQIRAVLLLQEDKDAEALELIRPLTEFVELQIMASELEAQAGENTQALARIVAVLKSNVPSELLPLALATKARIAINSLAQKAADEALEELVSISPKAPQLILLKSAYDRAFVVKTENEYFAQFPDEKREQTTEEKALLTLVKDAQDWDFFARLQASQELLARGYFRECAELLRDRVSLSKESLALKVLCDACLHGHLASLAKEINDGLAPSVKNSIFGWKFGANVAYLTGDIAKAVPLTRKLFEHNSGSISALEWHVKSLIRTHGRERARRLIRDLVDEKLSGTIQDRCNYVKILVFCGEIERARNLAYRLFCENQNDHQTWLALSSSVLALGIHSGTVDEFLNTKVKEGSTFEVLKPDGNRVTFTIETDQFLLSLRDGNIPLDHPVAKVAYGKSSGEIFDWPIGNGGQATIVNTKHKVLAAFHMMIVRFEERFPAASGFKSVSLNFENEDGLNELKTMLMQRADYSQSKAREYSEGSYPICVLGYHLGIDPIDAMLSLKSECGYSPKVSSCSFEDQDKAAVALNKARRLGIIADAGACYLMRRLGLVEAVEKEFGPIGVTQTTIDVFTQRLQETENSVYTDTETGKRKSGSMYVHNRHIVFSELTEQQVNTNIEVQRSDLDWLKAKCVLVAAVAKQDPVDAIIQLHRQEVGRFLDDIFAADGSGRVLISDDYHLRQLAEGIFGAQGAWMQAVLFHLESTKKISIQEVVKGTVHLCGLGQDALSTSADRILAAAEMLNSGEQTEGEFTVFCSLLGQTGAYLPSHIVVAMVAIDGLWSVGRLFDVRQKATSIILRCLLCHQSESARSILEDIQIGMTNRLIQQYISGWQIGHFLGSTKKLPLSS